MGSKCFIRTRDALGSPSPPATCLHTAQKVLVKEMKNGAVVA